MVFSSGIHCKVCSVEEGTILLKQSKLSLLLCKRHNLEQHLPASLMNSKVTQYALRFLAYYIISTCVVSIIVQIESLGLKPRRGTFAKIIISEL